MSSWAGPLGLGRHGQRLCGSYAKEKLKLEQEKEWKWESVGCR